MEVLCSLRESIGTSEVYRPSPIRMARMSVAIEALCDTARTVNGCVSDAREDRWAGGTAAADETGGALMHRGTMESFHQSRRRA